MAPASLLTHTAPVDVYVVTEKAVPAAIAEAREPAPLWLLISRSYATNNSPIPAPALPLAARTLVSTLLDEWAAAPATATAPEAEEAEAEEEEEAEEAEDRPKADPFAVPSAPASARFFSRVAQLVRIALSRG